MSCDGVSAYTINAWKGPFTVPLPSHAGKLVPDHGQTTCAFFGTNLSPTAYSLQPSDTAEETWKMTFRYPVHVQSVPSTAHNITFV